MRREIGFAVDVFEWFAGELKRIFTVAPRMHGIRGPLDNLPFDYRALRALHGHLHREQQLHPRVQAIITRDADLIAFGKPFISNLDLVARLKSGAKLAEPDRKTFYGGGEQGDTD